MKDYNNVIRFLIYAFGLCLGWFVLYDTLLSSFDYKLTIGLVESSAWLLQAIGFEASTENHLILINGEEAVFVWHACNGMVLMALFTGFIIAFPGPISKKIFFIPFGIAIINLLNVLRIAALAINGHYYHSSLNFNHKFTFTILIYSAIFALWMLWVKKFSNISINKNAYPPSVKHQPA